MLFRHVLDGFGVADPLIRMRAADAVEKITTRRPELLQAHKKKILRCAASATEKEVRWHMAPLLTRLKLTPRERAIVLDILFDYLRDSSSIVRTFAMQALADLAIQDASLNGRVLPLIEELTQTGTPAMRARGRKLLRRLKQLPAPA